MRTVDDGTRSTLPSERIGQPGSFRWSPRSERAAVLIAQDTLTDRQIAVECEISPKQLDRWKRQPDFRERVAAQVKADRERLGTAGLADKLRRVGELKERHALLKQVLAERAEDLALHAVPGGTTGLLVRQEKNGREYYALDATLLRELRDLEKQLAQELGQWVEKQAQTDSTGADLALDELVARYARAHGR